MKQTLFIFALSLFALASPAQTTITTIAGGGSSLGDGGLAVECKVNHPVGIAVDHAGNIYISDRDNHRIRKITTAGIITTIAGTGIAGFNGDGGPAMSAQINSPYGIAFDDSGNIYFSDCYNFRIRKIATSGIITTIAGDGTMGTNGDGGPATLAQFMGVSGVAVDKKGNILLADELADKVRMITNTGVMLTIAGTGSQGHTGDGGIATLAKLHDPFGLVLDSSGNIIFSENWGNCVRKIDKSGIITTIAGTGIMGFSGDNGPATLAGISRAPGVAVDADGSVYISDFSSGRLRKVDNFGIIRTLAGTGVPGFNGDGTAITTQLNGPCCLALDGQANLLFSDFNNNLIRKISSTLGVQSWSLKNSPLDIYPNPTNGPITISLPTRVSHINITIADMLGQVIQRYSDNDVTEVRTALNAPPGCYVISATSPEGSYCQMISVF